MRIYTADPTEIPWKHGATEGLTFSAQLLLSGEDGGPEAIRFRFDASPSIYAHMHLTAQFQLLLGGTMNFPRNNLMLRPPGVHYTDHNTPYGPFSVGEGHDVLVLHPRQGGLMTMGNLQARKEINLTGRVRSGMASEVEWIEVPGQESVRYKMLIPNIQGPEATILECQPHAVILSPPAPYGRYEVVLEGGIVTEGRLLGSPGFRYIENQDRPTPIQAGPEGATVIFLSFDKNALEGGLTGEGIAVEAAQAMANAI